MAFTNAWSVLIPPGTLPANQIDTAIQQTRLDIGERLNQLIGSGSSMGDDPIVNGTTVKDITTIVSELATKSTISGLINGRVLVSTSATTIGSSSVTTAQLVNSITPTEHVDTYDGSNSIVFDLTNVLETGTWLLTFQSNDITDDLEIENTGSYDLIGNGYITAVLFHTSGATLLCKHTSGGTGSFSYRAIRLKA